MKGWTYMYSHTPFLEDLRVALEGMIKMYWGTCFGWHTKLIVQEQAAQIFREMCPPPKTTSSLRMKKLVIHACSYRSQGLCLSTCLREMQSHFAWSNHKTTSSSAKRCLPNVLHGFTQGSDMRSRKDERILSQCGCTWIYELHSAVQSFEPEMAAVAMKRMKM